jgi:hypothetical protein
VLLFRFVQGFNRPPLGLDADMRVMLQHPR